MALPELLAPAGCWDSLRAAVANGADAVYFGVDAFNARMRAANFQRHELPQLMDWLHRRGVQGFLTVNVLIFADELEEAGQLVLAAAAAGVDALIVQDIGLMRLARQLAPDLAIHASTQMSVTSAAGVAQAAALGCRRVVLARELSLKDLGRIQVQLAERGLAVPLEVFVHGALCVAYSGQCLTSEALGQRSANRGECAQACRLPYQLVVDGLERDLDDQRYLLSPQDLAAWDLLPRLVDLGIASLKIEGRLKDATYVAAVTDAYRCALDRRLEDDPGPSLELSFSRGLSHGWLEGVNHRRLVHGRWSKKRGPLIGRLEAIERDWWLLRTRRPIRPGQGLVFEAGGAGPLTPPAEIGGRVMAVERRSADRVALRLGPGRIDGQELAPGAPCWLTSDPALIGRWRRQALAPTPERPRGLALALSGRSGQPLTLTVLAAASLAAAGGLSVRSRSSLQPATGAGLARERLQAQLGRLGGTGWCLERLALDLPPGLFLPVADLNRLRRELVAALAELQEQAGATTPAAAQSVRVLPAWPRQRAPEPTAAAAAAEPPALHVLVRSLEQLRALQGQPLASVIAELEHPRQLREAVAIGRGCWPGGIWLAGTRITRPDEVWSLAPLIQAAPDGYLVRNADQLERLTPLAPCAGDFSLNVANPLSAAWFLEHWGLSRLTASYDLDLPQLLQLVAGCPAGSLEVTIHQHMPLFHMEHCLFCAFLSDGHDHTDCGRPCERHTVMLRDRSGAEHPLRADLGCRNTLFNGRAQSAAEALPQLQRAGVRHVRLELLEESGEQARLRVAHYLASLEGRLSGRELWRRQRLESRLGVTRGSLKADP